MIRVEQISFGYQRDQFIFKELSFSLAKGETLSILGPNGVGKTTLIKCLLGFHKLSQGKIFLDNRPIESYSSKEFFQKISYVPQAKQVVFPYSVLDMVLMGRAANIRLHRKPSAKDVEKAEEAIHQVGLSHLRDRSVRQISGGQLQLVLIARAIVNDPKVLVLDEPESHLDMKNQLMILDLLEKLRERFHLTVIINTHFPNHALRLGGKALLLGAAHDWCFGRTEDVISYESIQQYFHVDSFITEWQSEGERRPCIFPIRITQQGV